MFIDMHTHFLPKIDDGAADVEISLSMLEESVRQGVELCVATPHCILRDNSCIDKFINDRQKSLEILLNEQKKRQICVPRILLGAEVYLDNDISKFEGIERLCVEGTRIMLIELPEGKLTRRSAERLYNLNLLNIHPLLAHIERNNINAEFFAELSELDIDYQINAYLFLSFIGRRKLKNIISLNQNLIVSSDMHNTDNRCCDLSSAYNIAISKMPESADALFYNNALQLLNLYRI